MLADRWSDIWPGRLSHAFHVYRRQNPAYSRVFLFPESEVSTKATTIMTLRHFLTTQDYSRAEIDALLELRGAREQRVEFGAAPVLGAEEMSNSHVVTALG
ncbi:MAG: hypothetical protein JO278_14785 [Dyella sp.]|nr:hypothetical protein [Dyella sp.]